ncbi:hypothetical protein BH23THE1_BH23THE1_34120 [soil metagenome]
MGLCKSRQSQPVINNESIENPCNLCGKRTIQYISDISHISEPDRICIGCNVMIPNPTRYQSMHSSIEKECVICLAESPDYVITTCGHKCMCYKCGQKINKCPICQKDYSPINQFIRVFEV